MIIKIAWRNIFRNKKRTLILNDLTKYIQLRIAQNKKVCLTFICTHNSRRSHLSQVWAQSIAHHFLIKNINLTYQGRSD